jgi:F-type H+-transporting ATPase subunit alpha
MKGPLSEISTLLESKVIDSYSSEFTGEETGRVLSIGDGIARVHVLQGIQAGELVEFSGGIKGMALNLEDDVVGIVLLGSDTAVSAGDQVRCTGTIVDVQVGLGLLGRGVTRSLNQSLCTLQNKVCAQITCRF